MGSLNNCLPDDTLFLSHRNDPALMGELWTFLFSRVWIDNWTSCADRAWKASKRRGEKVMILGSCYSAGVHNAQDRTARYDLQILWEKALAGVSCGREEILCMLLLLHLKLWWCFAKKITCKTLGCWKPSWKASKRLLEVSLVLSTASVACTQEYKQWTHLQWVACLSEHTYFVSEKWEHLLGFNVKINTDMMPPGFTYLEKANFGNLMKFFT